MFQLLQLNPIERETQLGRSRAKDMANEKIKYQIVVDGKAASAEMDQFSSNAISSGSKMGDAWKKAAPAIIGAVAAITGAVAATKKVLDIYGDFEEQMTNVSTLVDTSQVDMGKLKDQILQLSPALGSATKNTEALYQAISAGVDPNNAVAFIGESAKAAKAGLTDTLTAVEGATTVLNAFGMSSDHVTKVFDQMFVAVKDGKTTFGELSSAIGKVAPIAKSAGVSTEELFGSIATLTKQGIKTKEAVTALKAAFTNIIKPGSEASKMAEKMGIDFSASALKSKGFAAFLDDVKVKTGGDLEVLGKLFGSVEALNSILALTSVQGGKDFVQTLENMKSSAGETDTAFEKQSKTYKASMESLKASLEKVGISVGSKIAPELAKATIALADWVQQSLETEDSGLNQFIEAAVVLWELFTKVVDAFSPILGVVAAAFKGLVVILKAVDAILTPILKAIKALLSLFEGGIQWLVSWGEKLGGLGESFKSLGGWIGDVVEKLPGLGKGIEDSANSMDKLKKETKFVDPEIRKLANALGTLDLDTLEKGADLIEEWTDDTEELREGFEKLLGGTASEIRAMQKETTQLKQSLSVLGLDLPSDFKAKDATYLKELEESIRKLKADTKGGLVIILDKDKQAVADATKAVKEVGKQVEEVKKKTTNLSQIQITQSLREAEDLYEKINKTLKATVISKQKIAEFNKIEDPGFLKKNANKYQVSGLENTLDELAVYKEKLIEIKQLLGDVYPQNKEPKYIVEFLGEGSSIMPLSEKIAEMNDKMKGFGAEIEDSRPAFQVAFEDMAGNSLTTAMDSMESSFNSMFDSIVEGTLNVQDSFKDMIVDILQSIGKMLASQAIKSFVGMLGSAVMGGFGGGGTAIPAMAGGGDLSAGRAALVGERGPELFIPKGAGSVVPNHALGGGSLSVVNNINVTSSGDEKQDNKMSRDIARAIDDKIKMQIAAQQRPGGVLNPTSRVAMAR